MTEIQQKLLQMLKWFHEFCNNHNLSYYVLGGTLLGAVRHKGFIPWDDDIDIGMPRDIYNRLISLSKNTNGKYIFEFPLESKDYVYSFAKLYDSTTTLVENTRYKARRGICIDIFPLDGIGQTEEESIRNIKKIIKINKKIYVKWCAISKSKSCFRNVCVYFCRILPYSWRKLTRHVINESAKRSFNDSKYVANISGYWGVKEIMEREVFGDPTLYKFEDIYVFGPCDSDTYLKTMYGNYLELPPIEKRQSHHDFIELNLNKTYLEK